VREAAAPYILAIHLATELASLLAIRFSLRKGFDEFGFLRLSIFKDERLTAQALAPYRHNGTVASNHELSIPS
jgi:hypothetical protein